LETFQNKKELFLYIHFPFCLKKCDYCDFYSKTDLKDRNHFFTALNKEIDQYSKIISNSKIKTIYIGGGSPNLIPPKLLKQTVDHLKYYNTLNSIIEFTLEINPGNITKEKLQEFVNIGVNRISIGSQSFYDDELKFLGRIHDTSDIFNTIDNVRSVGIDNISLDLIFGIPGQNINKWSNNLDNAIKTNANHFSFYNLIYEHGTKLTESRNANNFQTVDEEIEFQMYELAHNKLGENNYQHYEISNWSKPGDEAIHNSAYWNGSNYLGLGPSAHSFYNGKRWSNIRSLSKYITNLNNNKSTIDFQEILNKNDKISEALLLGLRTSTGLSLQYFQNLTNIVFSLILNHLNKKFNDQFLIKYASINRNYLVLTIEGWFICDYIIEQVMIIIEEINNDLKKI
jgi:oxygen-independent coproporphyrinogen-3 oxidase